MKIFEIREYSDGGPNDKGVVIGYVKANNKTDAKKRAKITNRFKNVYEISRSYYEALKRMAKERYEIFNI
jgi:hypothetical protein